MKLTPNEIISISAANQNFSNVTRIPDKHGKASYTRTTSQNISSISKNLQS